MASVVGATVFFFFKCYCTTNSWEKMERRPRFLFVLIFEFGLSYLSTGEMGTRRPTDWKKNSSAKD